MKEYKRCTKCVMDNLSDETITFDEHGVCNYYNDAIRLMNSGSYLPGEAGKQKLKELIAQIKEDGKGKEYDCLMGVSGGLDSSYLSYLGAVKWGLRIMAVHIDDGFDTELAKENIRKLCDSCHVELRTITPDAEQFKDLTRAFILAELPNVATPQDNVLFACLYRFAKENGISHFLSGGNFALECILQKVKGSTNAMDLVHIKDIHRRFGTKPIDKLPLMSNWERLWNVRVHNIHTSRPLNYIDYNRDRAIQELNDFCGFTYYEAKHLENTLTKVVQLYWYYNKFKIDKRKSHLSSMIVSGQITRVEALKELEKPVYEEADMQKDINMVLAQLNIDRKTFDEIVKRPGKASSDYKTDKLFVWTNKMISLIIKDKKALVK